YGFDKSNPTLLENKQMIEVCRKNNVKLAAAYYRRFFSHIQKIKSLIAEGAIGDVVLAQSNYTGYYNPAKIYPEDPAQWRTDPQMAGGGVVMNCGSHRIDLLVYLLGDVAEVSAFVDTLHCNYPVEDSSVIIMRFATGAQAVANFNQNVRASTDEFAIYGTEGKIVATPLDSGNIVVHNASGTQEYNLPPTKITHLGLVQDFVQSIVTEREPISSGEDGMKASLVMDAVYKSSKLKQATPIL
ncbi:MAG: Gfo/Idh/MocA family protein, partial [Candidatus Poribacteria bacterium]